MKRFVFAVAALALSVGAVGVAQAHAKHDGQKLTFPMKSDEFQKHMDARVAKMRERLEHRITKKQLSADQAKELRAKFEAGVVQLNAATKQATADGVVTEDEAKQVRAVAKSMHPHHGGKKQS
jgi:hypothetical protein